MRKALAVVLISVLSAPSAAVAAPQGASTSTVTASGGAHGLRAAAMREATRLAHERTVFQAASEERPQRGSWIGRHPALFGAALGAGAGMVIAVSNTNELFCTGNDEIAWPTGRRAWPSGRQWAPASAR